MTNTNPSRADVYAALMQKCGFEVLEEAENQRQLRISGRCALERWAFFLPVIHKLITTSDKPGNPWTCDVSKKYIVPNGKVLYTWRLIFQGKELQGQYADIISTIRSAPRPARVELDRQLLPGYQPGDVRGGVNALGKGVSSAGSSPLIVSSRGTRLQGT